MKQFRILSMLMIVLISSLSFVSCGDDDDETSGWDVTCSSDCCMNDGCRADN